MRSKTTPVPFYVICTFKLIRSQTGPRRHHPHPSNITSLKARGKKSGNVKCLVEPHSEYSADHLLGLRPALRLPSPVAPRTYRHGAAASSRGHTKGAGPKGRMQPKRGSAGLDPSAAEWRVLCGVRVDAGSHRQAGEEPGCSGRRGRPWGRDRGGGRSRRASSHSRGWSLLCLRASVTRC